MKKLMLLLMMTLLVGTVSAFSIDDIDDIKNYNEETKTYKLDNFFGLGKHIANLELKTPQNNIVPIGYGVVAEIEIRNGEFDYNEIINGIKLYNIKEGMKEIFRDVDYKYKTNEGEWVDFTENSLIKGKTITLGIFTEVKIGDKVEWIINVYGNERLVEWAIWTASLSVDLISYYNFEEASGTTVFDSLITNNLTNVNGVTINVAGLRGMAYEWDNETYQFINSTGINFAPYSDNADFSISCWMKTTDTGSQQIVWNEGTISGDNTVALGFTILSGGGGLNIFSRDDDSITRISDTWGSNLDDSNWHNLIFTSDSSEFHIYIDGVSFANTSYTKGPMTENDFISFGARADGDEKRYNGLIDECAFWGRELSFSEVEHLYGGGGGISFEDPYPIITLNSPVNGFKTSSQTINFNGSVLSWDGLVNVTLFINGVLNETNSSGINNTDYLFTKIVAVGSHNWTYESCDIDGDCVMALLRNFNVTFLVENFHTFNSSVFETEFQSFTINISTNGTIPSNAKLIYDGTTYTGATIINTAGNDYNISRSIDVSATNGTKDFYFSFTFAGFVYNVSTQSQIVNDTEFGLCNSTVTLVVPYINFTFKDEADNSFINATIDSSTWEYWLGEGSTTNSLLFSNTTENDYYAFCFNGGNRTLHNTRSIQYALAGYPQRKYDAISDLTNTVTNKILWLLSSSDGIYSTIQVVDVKGDRVIGVSVTAERQFSGIWTIIGQEETDDAGAVTFWLNPDYDHKFTFVSDDCVGTTVTVRPTQTQYTQQLQCDGTGEDFVSNLEGLRYSRTPIEGIIQTGITNFTYFVTSSKYTIVNASFKIVSASDSTVLNSTSLACASNECLLYFLYDVQLGDDIKGVYYVDFGNGSILIEGDARWVNVPIDIEGKAGLSTFWNDLRYVLDDWGADSNTGDFNRLVVIFFFMALGIAFLNYHFDIDTQNPGAFMIVLTGVILSGSLVGGLDGQGFFYYNNLSSIPFVNNYILAFLMIIISGSYFIQVNTQAKR